MAWLSIFSLIIPLQSLADVTLYSTIEPPQQMKDNGTLTGIGVDVVRAIQKELGIDADIHIYPWARSLALAKKNKDSVAFLAAMTEERSLSFVAVGPVLRKQYLLYASLDYSGDINSLNDAATVKSIACMRDDVRTRFLIDKGFRNLEYTASHTEGLQLLLMNRVTLWTSSDWELESNLRELDIKKEQIKPVLVMYQGFNNILINKKSDPKMIDDWKKALRKIKDDGRMEEIAQKWGKKLGLDLFFDKQYDAIGIR